MLIVAKIWYRVSFNDLKKTNLKYKAVSVIIFILYPILVFSVMMDAYLGMSY